MVTILSIFSIPAFLAILIGIIILIWPKIINYAIALWLIVYGLLQIFQGYL